MPPRILPTGQSLVLYLVWVHLGYRRWGIATAAKDAGALSFGYYDNNANPHYSSGGNAGYTGTGSKMWLATTGSLSTTSQGVLWGATNDGSGSGLDADTVRGSVPSFTDTNTNFPQTGQTWTLASGYSVAQGDWGLRNTTPSGWIQFGPANTSHAHIYTNLSNFYFNVNTMYQNGHLIWAANNDGAGSGLDADLLDGQQGSYYHSQGSTGMAGTSRISDTSNFNNTLPSGWYQSSSASNKPGTSWYNMMNVRHSNSANDHGFQIAMSYYDNNFWSRSYQGGSGANNGSYQAWAKSWTTANDGSGSGLDADLLDGLNLHNTQGTQNGANTVLRTQVNGYTMLGWINTTSGVASGTPTRIYCSQDSYIRYYTPASLAPYILNQGSTKNAHVHSEYLTSNADDTFSGDLVSTSRNRGIFGTYNSTLTDHIWSMGAAYKNPRFRHELWKHVWFLIQTH